MKTTQMTNCLSKANYHFINHNTPRNKPTSLSEIIPEIDAITINLMSLRMCDCFDLQENLEQLIKSLHGRKLKIEDTVRDFWSFYFKTRLFETMQTYLKNNHPSFVLSIEKYYKMLLLIVLFCYDTSLDHTLFKSTLSLLNQSLIKLHRIMLILCDYILNQGKINIETLSKKKYINIIKEKMTMVNNDHFNEIDYLLIDISSNINKLINKYTLTTPTPNGSEIKAFYENLPMISIDDINLFFQGEIIREGGITPTPDEENISQTRISTSSSTPASLCEAFQEEVHLISIPIVITENLLCSQSYDITRNQCSTKPYTLVLDLDETLIHFTFDTPKEGRVIVRPYLIDFLTTLSKVYEIVVFTASIKEYANSILNAIENYIGRKVFNYRLYREDTYYTQRSIVKDLRKLGKDLSKVIIVDNIPDNFKLQKENGIQIFPFYGWNTKDQCLFHLKNILEKIASRNDYNQDLRQALVSYDQELKVKVSKE